MEARLEHGREGGAVGGATQAALAPRAFLAVAPLHDDNFEWSGVDDCINAARPIYELLGKKENLMVVHPDCAHDFPEASRKIAYEFLDRHLK